MNDEATKERLRLRVAECQEKVRPLVREIKQRNLESLVEMARRGETLPPLSPEYAIKVFELATALDGDELEEGASPKP